MTRPKGVIAFRGKSHSDSERERIGSRGPKAKRAKPTGGPLRVAAPADGVKLTPTERRLWKKYTTIWPWLRESDGPILVQLVRSHGDLEAAREVAVSAKTDGDSAAHASALRLVRYLRSDVVALQEVLGGTPGRRIDEEGAGEPKGMSGVLQRAGL